MRQNLKDKDIITGGTASAHVEDTTINENTTAPKGETSLSAHVSETSQVMSRPSRMVKEILGVHPIDDNLWDNTNSADVFVATVDSEEQMTGRHITEFHTHKDKQPAIADLLCQEDQKYDDQHNQQLTTHEHNTRRGYHNSSNSPSNTSVDHKLVMCKYEPFSIEAMKNEDITTIMDELTTVKLPLNPLGSSNHKSTLYWISQEVIKEAVENKKAELK